MMPPTKLLAIAYACSPGRGSEWGLAWAFVREVARAQPVWVVTHAENRDAIEPHLAAHPPEHPIHVEYVTMPRWVNWFGARGYAWFNVQYYLWNFAAARAARRLHAAVGFDLVQHVSLMRWWMPSAGATLARRGAKFIFGPVSGGELMPPNFRAGTPAYARRGEWVRNVAVKFWSHDPLLARTVRRAALVLAGTPQTAQRLARHAPAQLMTIPSGATSGPEILDAARRHRAALPAGRKFRFVSSGGLSYFRGVDLALRAFARAGLPDAEYVHASDGPDRARLEALAQSLGLGGRVRFLGDAPHAENVKVVATADVYVHTVLRDSMGLIPDALSLGVPVLTLDHNTMALLVDETVGHKVPMGRDATPEGVVDALATTMRRWHDDAALRLRLGANGPAFAEQFTAAGRSRAFRAAHARALAGPAPSPASSASAVPPATPARAVGRSNA